MAPPPEEQIDRTAGLIALFRDVCRWRSVRVLLGLGTLLRVVFVLLPGVPHEAGDAPSYLEPARNLVRAGVFALGSCPGSSCTPLLWRVPVYSVFIAVIKELPHLPVESVYVAQIILDCASIVLCAVIGWWLRDRRLAVLAAAFAALNPFVAVFAAEVMSESLTDFLVLLLTYGLLVAAETKLAMRAVSLIGLGALMGILALTRQVFAVIPAFALLFLFARPLRTWFRAALLVSAGFWPVVTPWLLRQYVVVRDQGISDLNQAMLAPPYSGIVRPGFAAWERSFEEPFVLENFAGPPVVARYLVPNEWERTADLFVRLNDNDRVSTPEIDAGFAAIAHDRREQHPFRTRVWAPLTRVFKSFAAPRLAGLGVVAARLVQGPGKIIVGLAMVFNAATSLPGFVFGAMRIREPRHRVLLMFPIFNVAAYLPVTFGGQSRYMVPVLAHLAILTGAWVLTVIARMRKPAGAPEQPEAVA